MELRISILLLFLTVTSLGCATPQPKPRPTIVGDTNLDKMAELKVYSEPSGAYVKFSTGETCSTPCTVKRENLSPFSLTISKEGYRSRSVKVTNNLEKLRTFNKSRGASEKELALLKVKKLSLVPNPVRITLEPDMMF